MSFILAFYGLAVLAIIGAAYCVYRVLATRSRLLGSALALLVLSLLVLLWPIPMHGTFSLLGEMLVEELGRALSQRAHEARKEQKREFLAQAEDRFSGTLNFSVAERLSNRWYRVLVDSGQPAWYDGDSRMLWSQWLPFVAYASLPSLKAATARCLRHPPAGYWALISEAEIYLLWKSGGRDVLPPVPASSVSYIVDEDTNLEMPTYTLHRLGGNTNTPRRAERNFVVRCVARGADAPPGGYLHQDIPLEEWNRYQLSKLAN